MTYEPISTEPCPCGHPSCKRLFLVGIGLFFQGSGFTQDEADEIVAAVNHARLKAAHAMPDDKPVVTIAEQPAPDAPAPDSLLDLVGRVSDIIRKEYFTHTRNERKSYDCAQNVLQEVMRTYEQLAERASPESLS